MYIVLYHSELWRQENAMQQNLAMLKEELSKKDQGLRSMTGKVSNLLLVKIRVSLLLIVHFIYMRSKYWNLKNH